MKIKIGNIYRLDYNKIGRPANIIVKVLAFDDYELLLDEYVLNTQWSLYPYNKYGVFSRQSRAFAEQVAELIEEKPLTKEEYNIIRPDLPIRFGRIKNISWGDSRLESIEKIRGLFMEVNQEHYLDEVYNINKIYLVPLNKSGNRKPPQMIEADNKEFFTSAEILYKANQLQINVNPNKSAGIGIFRYGIKNKTPSFYIWEYYDLAETMNDYD